MSRPTVILGLLSVFVCNAASQSIPQELLSTPTRLELDKPSQEAKAGSTVTYTVTLKDSGAGSFAIGFVGGVLGRKFWKVD